MPDNEQLYERAERAINELYSDQTVSPEKCKENMLGLIDDIQIKIDALGI